MDFKLGFSPVLLGHSIRAFGRGFGRATDGAIAPLFAMLMFVLFGVGGLALDAERGQRIKSRLTDASDAANLAALHSAIDAAKLDASRSKSEIASEAEALGKAFFISAAEKMQGVTISPPDLKIEYDNGTWTAKLNYEAKTPASLATAIGFDSIDVKGKGEASISPGMPALDIAMCVDSTGSMTPTLDAVKTNALNFFDNLNQELKNRNMEPFPVVRVRMMYFKDYGDTTPGIWDPDPLNASNFFSLPSEASNFSAFVSPQMAGGGADAPESGLECLNEAIDSPWLKPGDVPSGSTDPVTDVFPLIVVWTDTSTHSIGFPNSLANPAYPPSTKMPRTYADMLAKWNDSSKIAQKNKQILFFGDPDIYPIDGAGDTSAWQTIKTWPRFAVGGTLLEANASMVSFLAEGIATTTKSLRLTQ